MSLRSVCILTFSYLLLVTSLAQAAYPQNPQLLNDSIYVSQQGIYKFDRNLAEPIWSSLAGIETFEPVIHQDLLLVGSTQGLYALNLDTGRVSWHIEKQHTLFSPTISAKAYAGSVHGELYAIDPQNGRIDWRRQFTGWIYSPVVSEEMNLLWTGGQEHQVYAIDTRDGNLQQQIATTQESVFSAVDLGARQVAFNLFDGTTLVVRSDDGQATAILDGDSQPTGIYAYRDTIYRSHRDGSLSAFAAQDQALKWRRSLVPQDLFIHPSQPGYLLLSDRDRSLLLLNLEQSNEPCSIHPQRQWLLPLQLDTDNIIYFQKTMQPPGLSLVQIRARCK